MLQGAHGHQVSLLNLNSWEKYTSLQKILILNTYCAVFTVWKASHDLCFLAFTTLYDPLPLSENETYDLIPTNRIQ